MPKTSRRDFLRWTLAGSGLLLAGAASVLEPVPARAVGRGSRAADGPVHGHHGEHHRGLLLVHPGP